MDGEAFRVGGHLGSSPAPYPSSATENPSQNQFLFDARSAPLQLQLFGNAAGKTQCCIPRVILLFINVILFRCWL